MKEIIINSLTGFGYQEDLSIEAYSNEEIYSEISTINANRLFWAEVLSDENILDLTQELCSLYTHETLKDQLQLLAIKSNPAAFITQFKNAKEVLLSGTIIRQSEYFYCLETLELAAYLHSFMRTHPFILTLDLGFLRSNDSSLELWENCLRHTSNPYLAFINEHIIPRIVNERPQILWLEGRPNIGTFAIARLLKLQIPKVFLAITYHSSEYYSLGKIKDLLLSNDILLNTFDCIVLDDSVNTIKKIRTALYQGQSLTNIENIIGKSTFKFDRISDTHKSNKSINSLEDEKNSFVMDSFNITSIKLFPDKCCFWQKCTFCGINSKYSDTENKKEWDVIQALHIISKLKKCKNNSFWSIDEAIPAIVLKQIAQHLVQQKSNLIWQVRARIDDNLIDEELCELLAESGLKEIRFGLESASERILGLMNKSDKPFQYIEIAEKIVEKFSKYNIKTHFPVIIGFPTETEAEREETFSFLKYLKTQYPKFSYNVNILEIDISSRLFKEWQNYSITSLSFPCVPKYFLGNNVQWQSKIVLNEFEALSKDRQKMMLFQYSWYPESALIKPHIFYRILEYSRRTFLSDNVSEEISVLNNNDLLLASNYVAVINDFSFEIFLYNFKNHQLISCGELVLKIYEHFKVMSTLQSAFFAFPAYSSNLCKEIIQKLFDLGFLTMKGGEHDV